MSELATVPKAGPCAFCGNVETRIERDIDDWIRVVCPDCGATGPVFGDEETPVEERKADAVEAWSRARPPSKRAKRVRR